MLVKKGDNVIVLAGKDKNKKAKVLRAFPKTGEILLDAVNIVKRHQKKRREGEKGQVISVSMPVNASIVALVCPSCGKGARVRVKFVDSRKVLVCARCNSSIRN